MKKSILPFERILTFEESNLLKNFISKAVEVFERWGYNYLKLPAFDHYEVHREALGERVREVITFKEDENLIALRADFTAQVVRSVSFFKVWHYPLRIYYFGTFFSAKEDTYERFQVGVELIGVREIEGLTVGIATGFKKCDSAVKFLEELTGKSVLASECFGKKWKGAVAILD